MRLSVFISKYGQGVKQDVLVGILRLRRTSKLMGWLLTHAFQRVQIRLSLIRIWGHRIPALLAEPLRVWTPLVPEIYGVPQSEWIRAYNEDTEAQLGGKKWIDQLDLQEWHQGWVSGAKWALRNASGGNSPTTQANNPS